MESTAAYNLSNIYLRLKELGIDKRYIHEVLLPEWWNDEMLTTKAGFIQTASTIAKNLSVGLSELLDTGATLALKTPIEIRFKTRNRQGSLADQFFPNSISAKLSKVVFKSFGNEIEINPSTSSEMRREYFTRNKFLDLAGLTDFLWSKGIPVVYISKIPAKVPKFDGMTYKINGRPIIVVSSKRAQDAWLLFILAHELGHIFLGHLSDSENGIIDTDISELNNSEEEQANNYAIEFLINDINNLPSKTIMSNPFKIANVARECARLLQVDPGQVALMTAYRDKTFPTVSKALNILNPNADAAAVIKSKMAEHLKLDELSGEDREFFERITGLTGE